MNVRYRVELSQDERDELTALLSGGPKIRRSDELLAEYDELFRPSGLDIARLARKTRSLR